jgi:CBS-domain-containing membrane protein
MNRNSGIVFRLKVNQPPIKENRMDIITVESVYKLLGTASRIIPEDTPIGDIIAAFARDSSIGSIFLVDPTGRYAGMITRTDLLKWTHIRLLGGKGRDEIPISELLRLANALKAKDMARSNWKMMSVSERDTIQTALNKMLDEREDIIPVVDEGGNILGDLRLSEILAFMLNHEEPNDVK